MDDPNRFPSFDVDRINAAGISEMEEIRSEIRRAIEHRAPGLAPDRLDRIARATLARAGHFAAYTPPTSFDPALGIERAEYLAAWPDCLLAWIDLELAPA